MKKIFFLSIIAAVITFAGCNKMEDITNDGTAPLKNGFTSNMMRNFKNFDALNAEIDTTLKCSYEELVAYELSIGFNSFGKLADQAMDSILQEVEQAILIGDTSSTKFATLITQMVNAQSHYLHFVTDDEGEEHLETKYCMSSFRYVMNVNRMFRVDTLCFKVFEGGHVSCDTAYYNQLLIMSESDFSVLESNKIFTVFKYEDGGRGNYGTYVIKGIKGGGRWLYVCLHWNRTYLKQCELPGFEDIYNVKGYFYVRTWAERLFCGKWIGCYHTYTNDITASIAIGGHSNCPIKTGKDKGSTTGMKYRQRNLVIIDGDYYKGNNIYIHSSYGYGEKPNLRCYVNLY